MTQIMYHEGKPAYIVTGGKPIEFLSDAVADEIGRLRAINADMLAALDTVAEWLRESGKHHEGGGRMLDLVRSTISRATQEG